MSQEPTFNEWVGKFLGEENKPQPTSQETIVSVDAAAKEYANKVHTNPAYVTHRKYTEQDFKAGAQWQSQQPITHSIDVDEDELIDFEYLVSEILIHQTILNATKRKKLLTSITQAYKSALQSMNGEKRFTLKDIEDAFDAGMNRQWGESYNENNPEDTIELTSPNKEQYLSNLKNKNHDTKNDY